MQIKALCNPSPSARKPGRGCFTKTLLVMKLTGIILLAGFLQVSAHGTAQTVTFRGKAVPLTQVFSVLEKQTGYVFFYNSRDLEGSLPVTVNLRNAPLENALNAILAGQPLRFIIKGNTILITRSQAPALQSADTSRTPPTGIAGIVIDENGQPLPGASVSLKDTKYKALTNNQGSFTFPTIPQGKYTLIISYIGYTRLEEIIEIEDKIVNLRLVLHPSTSSLDQIQVVGYGVESKRFSVGSISTINAEIIEKQPVTNLLLALEGQVPGLAVTATSGVPGSTVLVQVRGQNTLANTPEQFTPYDQPLFIVDGVPFSTQNNNINQLGNLAAQSFGGGISQPAGFSPFNGINPNDIESISILRDADATSIYGSQGANGVILITTKKGKPGKTTFDLNLNTQYNSVARPVQLLNTQQYLQLRKEAYAVDSITPGSDPLDYLPYAPDLTIFDQNKYTNWEKIITGNTTNNTDLHASVSGGTVDNTFLVSTGYTRSDYNYPGNFADQRYTLHSALHGTSVGKRFTFGLVTDFAYDQNNSASTGGNQYEVLAPNTPDLRDPAGNLIWNYKGVTFPQNFYSSLKQPTYLQNFNLNSSLNLSYQIVQGLTIGASLGYSRNTTDENSQNPASAQDPQYANAIAAFAHQAAQTINVEPQVNYDKPIGKGILTALLGGTYKKNTGSSNQTYASGYTNDNFLGSINGAATISSSDASSIYRYSAAFARLKYIYDQKYIIEFSGRRDGSSNFGPGRQFGNFGSVGAGWIFSEEKAFKKALPFFSYGKLSGSYGTTGGDASVAYSYQAMYQSFASSYFVQAFQNIRQDYPYNLYNPDFSWATKKSLNLALDFGFFNNRLLLNATYYRHREGNQLVDYPLPTQTGFTGVYGNLNALVQNKGYEFSATSTNIKSKNFSWTTTFNLTFNRNKLISFPNLALSSYSQQYIIGQPTTIVFGYKYKDVNPTTGLFEFYDKTGKVTYAPNYGTAATGGDYVQIANGEINYMGGFGNNFTYKHFSLYVFCQFSSGNAYNYLYAVYNPNNFPGEAANQPVAILNKYWKQPGDHTALQRLLSSNGINNSYDAIAYFTTSSGAYGNDTYLRVKTAALSYALPDAFLKKLHIQGGSIYVRAQNLFTITNYKVGDPEQPGSFLNFPLQRIIASGLNFKF